MSSDDFARQRTRASLALVILCTVIFPEFGNRAVGAGALKTTPKLDAPTHECLGVHWTIPEAGPNAVVQLEYRRSDEAEWRTGLDLFRVDPICGGKKQPAFETAGVLFAGSVFGLSPGTEYVLKLGLAGEAAHELRARTRIRPQPYSGDRLLHVVPGKGGGTGSQDDPFKGTAAAAAVARPGDVFLLRKGVYPGTLQVTKSGTIDKPITWRGATDGPVIIDGLGADRAVSGVGTRHVRLERLVLKNAKWLAVFHDAEDVVVQRCRFHVVYQGYVAYKSARGHYVADNIFEGPIRWPRERGQDPGFTDVRGVVIGGVGHVICHNRLSGLGDGIDTFRSELTAAIDIHNNDIFDITDDGIELDTSHRNVRAFRNRLANVYMGISTQPVLGGPAYIIRNSMYNVSHKTFKMHVNPSGVLVFHNTVVKQGPPICLASSSMEIRNTIFRNNLFIGGKAGYALETGAGKMIGCDFDYDGFGGGPFAKFMKWEGHTRVTSIAEAHTSGPQERHARLVDKETCFAVTPVFPTDTGTSYTTQRFAPESNDLRLAKSSGAVDGGVALPTINDDFAGKAPDLGAYELGAEQRVYGPRPE